MPKDKSTAKELVQIMAKVEKDEPLSAYEARRLVGGYWRARAEVSGLEGILTQREADYGKTIREHSRLVQEREAVMAAAQTAIESWAPRIERLEAQARELAELRAVGGFFTENVKSLRAAKARAHEAEAQLAVLGERVRLYEAIERFTQDLFRQSHIAERTGDFDGRRAAYAALERAQARLTQHRRAHPWQAESAALPRTERARLHECFWQIQAALFGVLATGSAFEAEQLAKARKLALDGFEATTALELGGPEAENASA